MEGLKMLYEGLEMTGELVSKMQVASGLSKGLY